MNTLSQNITAGYSDCDALGRLKPSAFLRCCQEVAERHCEILGCGREQIFEEEGLVWVVVRNQTNLIRTPMTGEKWTLETYTAPVRRFFFPRYFILRDASGEPAAQAASYWALLDVNTRNMVLSPRLRERDWNAGIPPVIPRFMAPPEPEGQETVFTRLPVYSDMDVNAHVNNTRYLDWLCDAMGSQVLKDHPLQDFLIDYHHEIRENQEVLMRLKRDDTCYTLNGFDGDTLLFSICGHFARKGG